MDKDTPEYFISLDDPFEFRKTVLATSKDLIVLMQKYERFKTVRIKKFENITRLKHVMAEIHGLCVKMKEIFPNAGVREKHVTEFISKIHERKNYLDSKPSDHSDYESELVKLEKELSSIENQLSSFK